MSEPQGPHTEASAVSGAAGAPNPSGKAESAAQPAATGPAAEQPWPTEQEAAEVAGAAGAEVEAADSSAAHDANDEPESSSLLSDAEQSDVSASADSGAPKDTAESEQQSAEELGCPVTVQRGDADADPDSAKSEVRSAEWPVEEPAEGPGTAAAGAGEQQGTTGPTDAVESAEEAVSEQDAEHAAASGIEEPTDQQEHSVDRASAEVAEQDPEDSGLADAPDSAESGGEAAQREAEPGEAEWPADESASHSDSTETAAPELAEESSAEIESAAAGQRDSLAEEDTSAPGEAAATKATPAESTGTGASGSTRGGQLDAEVEGSPPEVDEAASTTASEWPTDEQERIVPALAETEREQEQSESAPGTARSEQPLLSEFDSVSASERTGEQETVAESPRIEQTQQIPAISSTERIPSVERTQQLGIVRDEPGAPHSLNQETGPITGGAVSDTDSAEDFGGPADSGIGASIEDESSGPPTAAIPRVEHPTQQLRVVSEPDQQPRAAQPQDFFGLGTGSTPESAPEQSTETHAPPRPPAKPPPPTPSEQTAQLPVRPPAAGRPPTPPVPTAPPAQAQPPQLPPASPRRSAPPPAPRPPTPPSAAPPPAPPRPSGQPKQADRPPAARSDVPDEREQPEATRTATRTQAAPNEPGSPPPRRKPKRRARGVFIGVSFLLVIGLVTGLVFSGPALWRTLTGTRIADPPQAVTLRPAIEPIGTDAPQPDGQALASMLDGKAANPAMGSLSGVVQDAGTGSVLWERSAGGRMMTPASTGKVVSMSAALLALDHQKRFTTKVVRGSEPGTVVLVGGGDPTLSALPRGAESVYPGAPKIDDLAAQVRAATGGDVRKVVVDTSRYTGSKLGPEWLTEDVQGGYVAPIEPVMLDGGRSDPTAKDPPRTMDPALEAGQVLADKLGLPSSDVTQEAGAAPDGASALGQVRSATVRELAETVLRESDNVLAETLTREVAVATGNEPSFEGAAKAMREVLARNGFDASATGMVDGSGLSTANKLDPKLLGELLTAASAPQQQDNGPTAKLRDVLPGLPVAAGTGSLESRYGDSAGRGWVRAKTGTLSGVSALAGTVLTQDGRLLVFALISNGGSGVPPLLDDIASTLRECGCR